MKYLLLSLLLLAGCDSSASVSPKNSLCSKDNISQNELAQCAQDGDLNSQYELGMSYLNNQTMTAEDAQQSFHWISQAAEKGYMPAQNMMSWFYRSGTAVERNDQKAFEWAVKAAEAGSINSLNNVAFYYQQGIGVEKDPVKGLEYYRKAAEQGNVSAQKNLGLAYLNGWGTQANPQEALHWLLKSAEQGDQDGMINAAAAYNALGHYENGLLWLKKAADLGNSLAQASLGYMYAMGEGVTADKEQALFWLNKAMAQENAHAYYLMGKFHADSGTVFAKDEKNRLLNTI